MAQWRRSEQPKVPKLASLMDSAEQDVLAYITFREALWTKLYRTNSIERLNGEIKRRTEVVGTFPNDDAIVRLVRALLIEQNDKWAVQRSRYMTLETIATMSDGSAHRPASRKLIHPRLCPESTGTAEATPPPGTRSGHASRPRAKSPHYWELSLRTLGF